MERTITESEFGAFWDKNREDLIDLIKELQSDIDDDYRASDDPDDDTPAMQITISVNASCTEWSYQTGDNSFSGGCYSHPYWGVGTIDRDSDPADVASELIDDLFSVIEFDYIADPES